MRSSSLFFLAWAIFSVLVCPVVRAMPGREYVAGVRLTSRASSLGRTSGSAAAATRPFFKIPLPLGRTELAGRLHPITGVPFDAQGHPLFHPKFSCQLDSAHIRASNAVQFARANKALKKALLENPQLRQQFSPGVAKEILAGTGRKAPSGYVWHHDPQDTGKLELVDFDIHQKTHHAPGGKSIWGRAPSASYYRWVITRWTCIALLDLGVSTYVSYRRDELDETTLLRIGSGAGSSWLAAISTECLLARYWPGVAGGPAAWVVVAYLATRLTVDACWDAHLREQLARQEAACRNAECLARWQRLQRSVAGSNARIDALLGNMPPGSRTTPHVDQGGDR